MFVCGACGTENPSQFAHCRVCAAEIAGGEPTAAAAPRSVAAAPSTVAAPQASGMRAIPAMEAPRAGPALGPLAIAVGSPACFRTGQVAYTDFRVSRSPSSARLEVCLRVVRGVDDRDESRDFDLTLDPSEAACELSWRLLPRIAGECRIHSVRFAAFDPDRPRDVVFLRTRASTLSIPVRPGDADRPGQITIQGSVYGSLVGSEARAGHERSDAEARRWVELALVADDDSGWWRNRRRDVASVGPKATLAWSAGGRRRRLLIVAGPEIVLGRRKEDSDVVARWLPCRSEAEDPEHWAANLHVSRKHLAIRFESGGVVVEPAPGATGATYVIPHDNAEPQRWSGVPRLRGPLRLRLGAPGGTPVAGLALRLTPIDVNGRTAALLVQREENAPEMAYLAMNGPCGLDSMAADLPGLPAGLELVPVDGGIRLRGPATLRLADSGLTFEELSNDDFTRYPL